MKMTKSPSVLFWTFVVTSCAAIKVPVSWKDEERFLPYYAVVDGLPDGQNVDTYYPLTATNNVDQVVQNDVVVKLFQKMNPHLHVVNAENLQDPPKPVLRRPVPIEPSLVKQEHLQSDRDDRKDSRKVQSTTTGYEEVDEIPARPREKENEDRPDETRQEAVERHWSTDREYQHENLEDPAHDTGETQIKPAEEMSVRRNTNHRPRQDENEYRDGTRIKSAEGFWGNAKHRPDQNQDDPGDVPMKPGEGEWPRKSHRVLKPSRPDERKENHSLNYEINHEDPGEIPTKPVYPGQGQWARRGLKHRPHASKNVFRTSPQDPDDSNPGSEYYDSEKRKFRKQFDEFPKKYHLYPPKKSEKSKDDDSEEKEFEPYRSYAQVRKTITKKRLPKKKTDDPRLKESIKDSKIHTAYTEEGYEDSAYDHGDQEKRAESKEGTRRENNIRNLEEGFRFPDEPAPPADEDDASETREEEREEEGENPKIEKEEQSETKTDTAVEFESQRTPPSYDEKELIDSVMEESRYGEKMATKRRRKRRSTGSKYPNYDSKRVDYLSSFRYAENSGIPGKSKGTMSFYDTADKVECPEIPKEIDAVPDRAKAPGNGTETDDRNVPSPVPKLNNLGDQIDCLKARYFGEDPLDNPLFGEHALKIPSTIFKDSPITSGITVVEGREMSNDEENELDGENTRETLRLGKMLNDNRTEEALPDAEAYTIKRINRRPPYRYFKRNKTRPDPNRGFHRSQNRPLVNSDARPNPKRISEVHYKNEIKPSEQMNVFADVINNIKNSGQDPEAEGTGTRPLSIEVNVMRKQPPHRSRTPPPRLPDSRILPKIRDEIKELHAVKFKPPTLKQRPIATHAQADDNQIIVEVPKRYRKRGRKPQATTEDNQKEVETTRAKKREKPAAIPRPSSGFVPILKDEVADTNHKPEYEEIETSTANTYYIIGMRPPPKKPFSHPTYYLKRRRTGQPIRKRVARNVRRGYAEISRGNVRNRIETTTSVAMDEEDDYVPHRSRNFHYDEKSGKIVYEKKPETREEEEFEYEYVEVEEPTHPPTKAAAKKAESRRIWPSKYPDGPNYLDFIKRLKQDSSYVQILDPKPTEKPDVSSTATIKDVEGNTGLPEFLAILDRVRGDKNYKFIEDPTEKVKDRGGKKDERVAEKVIEEDVQNSPGRTRGKSTENPESVGTKSRNYSPKTNVDTSKYQTIQRVPNTRYNISSRYKSDDPQEPSMDEVESKLVESSTTIGSLTIELPTTFVPSTAPIQTATPSTTTTGITPNPVRALLTRRRGTTTPSPTTETITTPRRQRGRSKFRFPTTTEVSDSGRSRRNLQRRHQSNLAVPRNHKRHYAETKDVRNVPNSKPTPRSITLDLLKQTNSSGMRRGGSRSGNGNKLEDVEVFKDYDKNEKHGGNYKYKKVQIKITRNYGPYHEKDAEDDSPKPFSYYSDTKLPSRINRLKENGADVDESYVFDEDSSNEKDFFDEPSTEKPPGPVFIKDPNKRKYYYAPI